MSARLEAIQLMLHTIKKIKKFIQLIEAGCKPALLGGLIGQSGPVQPQD